MRALHSRWNLLVVILALGTLVGCGALQADPRTPQQNQRDNDGLWATGRSLNFGPVVVGSQVQAAQYIYNPTSSSITISGASSSADDFRVISPSFPVIVPSRRGVVLTVRYSPSAPGRISGNILISSDAPDPTLTLPAFAQAIAAGKLVVTPATVAFGKVQVGKSESEPESFTNPGGTSVTISQMTATSTDFAVSGLTLPVTLKPGQSVNFHVVFTPKASGPRNGNLAADATASLVTPTTGAQFTALTTESADSENEVATIAVAGMGTQVSSSGTTLGQIAAAPLSFGSPLVGSTQSKPLVISNAGTASVTVTQVSAGGPGYSLSGPSLPLTLAGGQTTSFSVAFAPASAGTANGTVTIVSDAENPTLSVALSATPVTPGTLTVSSNPVAFGTVPVGSSQKTSATLTNSGGSTVTLTQAAVSGTGFSMNTMGMPMTLAPNQSANVTITCSPQSAGTLTGSLSIASNASNANVAVPLTATAVASGTLTASSPSLSFGKVTVGSTQSMPETVTNSGGAAITLTQVAAGAGYSVSALSLPLTLNPGQSASFSVAFTPQSSGNSSVNLAITNSGATLTIPLSGTGTTPGSLSASSVSFGNVQVGGNSTQTATLSNSGGSSVTVSQANLTGSGAFTMSGLTLPMTLAAGQSFTFSVSFAPQSAGAASGSIALVSDASGTQPSVALSGSGTASGQFSVNPGSFSFGSVVVGASKSIPATLSATGASVTVTSASVNSTEFTLSGITLPVTIPAGGTASFSLVFTPQSSGTASANLSFATNAPGSPVSETLSGSGTAAPQHSVTLSWAASASNVTGYNVYRGGTTGGPYAKLTSSADGSTSYSDTSVQAGQTYYYVTTSVGTDGMESTYSNQVTATIPTP